MERSHGYGMSLPNECQEGVYINGVQPSTTNDIEVPTGSLSVEGLT